MYIYSNNSSVCPPLVSIGKFHVSNKNYLQVAKLLFLFLLNQRPPPDTALSLHSEDVPGFKPCTNILGKAADALKRYVGSKDFCSFSDPISH